MNNTTQTHNNQVKKQVQKTKKTRSCQTKKAYPTFDLALKSANHLHGKGIYVKPYQCNICNKFHITKREKESVLADLFKQIEKERKKTSISTKPFLNT